MPPDPTTATCPVCQLPITAQTEVRTGDAILRTFNHPPTACTTVQALPLSKEALVVRALVQSLRNRVAPEDWAGLSDEGRIAALRDEAKDVGLDYNQIREWCDGVPTDDLLT